LGWKNITVYAEKQFFDPDSDTIFIQILNSIPKISEPYYNVSPPEVVAGDPIKICCNTSDVEDYYTSLDVKINIKDPFDGWFNYTANYQGNGIFCIDYQTQETQLGNFTTICSVEDTDNGYAENTSKFLVYQNGTITMDFNSTEYWWYDYAQLDLIAKRKDNSVLASSPINITLNEEVVCSGQTNSTGGYTCIFQLPGEVGNNTIKVIVQDPYTKKKIANITFLEVAPTYGGSEEEIESSKQVSCYETPYFVVNPDGTIKKTMVRICTWK